MITPSFDELPSSPAGMSGWPWTEATPQLQDRMPDGPPWPRISIVTPSFNQAQFLEETIRSVLLQGYPNLEYIIIDGGSTDSSVDIIRKYEPWLTYWVSEQDRGQAHAINKGFARACGEIVAWINSDDVYEPGALARAATALSQNPDAAFVYSDCNFTDADGNVLLLAEGHPTNLGEMLRGNVISQPTVFYKSKVLRLVGALREELQYVMDYELWLRILQRWHAAYVPGVAASFRMYRGSKTVAQEHQSWTEIVDLLEAQHDWNIPSARMKEAVAIASMMASWAHLNVGQTQIAVKYLSKARDYGLFSRKTLPLAAKRTLAFLSINARLGASLQNVEQLVEFEPELGLPQAFWNWLSAFDQVEQAEVSFKQSQISLLRTHMASALRLAPALVVDRSVWPLILCGLLGADLLRFAVKLKQALFSLIAPPATKDGNVCERGF